MFDEKKVKDKTAASEYIAAVDSALVGDYPTPEEWEEAVSPELTDASVDETYTTEKQIKMILPAPKEAIPAAIANGIWLASSTNTRVGAKPLCLSPRLIIAACRVIPTIAPNLLFLKFFL